MVAKSCPSGMCRRRGSSYEGSGAKPRDSHGSVTFWRLQTTDRKSTRLNSSHLGISYAVFCLKKNVVRGKFLHVMQRIVMLARPTSAVAVVSHPKFQSFFLKHGDAPKIYTLPPHQPFRI